tara:strand:- start:56 stop:403 length:348 start_codon:yes stop_codon:yes gene_type:complete
MAKNKRKSRSTEDFFTRLSKREEYKTFLAALERGDEQEIETTSTPLLQVINAYTARGFTRVSISVKGTGEKSLEVRARQLAQFKQSINHQAHRHIPEFYDSLKGRNDLPGWYNLS